MYSNVGEIVNKIAKVVERDNLGRIADNWKTFRVNLSKEQATGQHGRPLSSYAQLFGWLTHVAFNAGHRVATGNTLECYDKEGKLLAKAKWVLVNPGTFDDKRCVKVLYPQEIGM
jgi:hypothetical protein